MQDDKRSRRGQRAVHFGTLGSTNPQLLRNLLLGLKKELMARNLSRSASTLRSPISTSSSRGRSMRLDVERAEAFLRTAPPDRVAAGTLGALLMFVEAVGAGELDRAEAWAELTFRGYARLEDHGETLP